MSPQIGPLQDKTYNKTYVTSKYLDLPVNPPSMARVLIYLSLDSLEAVESISKDTDQTTDMQADLSLRKSHKSFCWFCRALA